jgi:ADP-ribose pyrophosphatase
LKDLTEHFVAGGMVFDGNLLKVYRDAVRLPDGSQGEREYIRHPGAVAIVALTEDRKLLLERQYRYPPRREFIEIPAGKIDPGEAHFATAKRELLEETGYLAQEWTRLCVLHTAISYTDEAIELYLARKLTTAISYTDEAIELYLARKLTLQERKLDPGEFLESFLLPFDDAVAMVRDGRISDVKTVAAILWVKAFLP